MSVYISRYVMFWENMFMFTDSFLSRFPIPICIQYMTHLVHWSAGGQSTIGQKCSHPLYVRRQLSSQTFCSYLDCSLKAVTSSFKRKVAVVGDIHSLEMLKNVQHFYFNCSLKKSSLVTLYLGFW